MRKGIIALLVIVAIFASGAAAQAQNYQCERSITNIFTDPASTLQLGTFTCPQAPTSTPIPTELPTPTPTYSPLVTPTPTKNPNNVAYTPYPTLPGTTPGLTAQGKQYCVDEEPGTVHIESCDDATRCDIAHGGGGPGTVACGTVIGHEHSIIEFLLDTTNGKYFNSLSNNLSRAFQSTCYTAAPVPTYISTFNVIDTYSLAGLSGFSRTTHMDATALTASWSTTPGFTVSPTANGLTPGDAILFKGTPHVGIVNTVELDNRGNGDIWFLHTNAAYHLGKVMVANWVVVSSSTGDTNVNFGSHQSKGPDTTIGETICYCGGGICYQYRFN